MKISRLLIFLLIITIFSSCNKQMIKGGMICRDDNGEDYVGEFIFINDSCYIEKERRRNSYTEEFYYNLSVGHYYLDKKNIIRLRGDYFCKYLPVFTVEESYREENDSLKIVTFDITNLQGEKTNLELVSYYIYFNDDTINQYYINKNGRLWSFTADTSIDSSYQYLRKIDMKINKIVFTQFSPTVEYYCKTKNANHFSIMAPDISFNPIKFIAYTNNTDRLHLRNGKVVYYAGESNSWNNYTLIKDWLRHRTNFLLKYDWVDSSKISLEEMGAKELIRRWDMKILEPKKVR